MRLDTCFGSRRIIHVEEAPACPAARIVGVRTALAAHRPRAHPPGTFMAVALGANEGGSLSLAHALEEIEAAIVVRHMLLAEKVPPLAALARRWEGPLEVAVRLVARPRLLGARAKPRPWEGSRVYL